MQADLISLTIHLFCGSKALLVILKGDTPEKKPQQIPFIRLGKLLDKTA
jgi:hypothetical protein